MRIDTIPALAALFLSLLVPSRQPPPGASSTQPGTVIVTVIDAGTQVPLTNADVVELSTGRHHFTDESGQARLPWSASGQLPIRIRQIGYAPVERTLDRANPLDSAPRFAMSKVAYVISAVRSTGQCVGDADSLSRLLSASALEQLQQQAEKYAEFRRAYPFDARVERRTARVPERGEVRRIVSDKLKFSSNALERPYRPGDIVEYVSGGFNLPVLFLSTLADTLFWENHCAIARGIEAYQGTKVLRLEFSPRPDLHGPDWSGAALLDSATSYLLRVDFSVANLDPLHTPKRVDGYTTFQSPSPFVIMPDTTFGEWWLKKRGDKEDWGKPDYVQAIHIERLDYRKATPPAYKE